MGVFSFFGGGNKINAMAESAAANVLDAIRYGDCKITTKDALKNTAVKRSVSLISSGIGMLPLYIMTNDDRGKKIEAVNHPIYYLLNVKPNNWQTPFEFKRLMQLRALIYGEAHALKVKSGQRIVALQPLDPESTEVIQNDDWSLSIKVKSKNGGYVTYSSDDVLTIRDISLDGFSQESLVKQAAEILETSKAAAEAVNSAFKNGLMIGGTINSPNKLSKEAIDNIKKSLMDGFMGTLKAGGVPIFTEGLEFNPITQKFVDAQLLEMRNHQIEEISRIFGVPRPLLSMDETSWGSGIEQLALLFIQFSLAPWFTAWEQAVQRVLLTDMDRKAGYYADFDERELLRGSLKDQAEYYSKALGGQKGWLSQNEVRNLLGVGNHSDIGSESITPAIAIGKENVVK